LHTPAHSCLHDLQAIVSVLMNRPDLEIGPELAQLRDFTAGFPPDMKGLAIGNSDTIRLVHNSFSPPQPMVPDKDEEDNEKGDAFHFIAYVPVGCACGVGWLLAGWVV
jgi:ubiquitin carboxyl-terminal hydrolase L5